MKTHFRVDQILAGAVLALIHTHEPAIALRRAISKIPVALLILALVLTSHMALIRYDWVRAYVAMALIGNSLFNMKTAQLKILGHRHLIYLAQISFALYVIHPATMAGFLGSGTGWEKYLKRPLSFMLTFGLAHLSTYYFENRFIKLGKSIIDARRTKSSQDRLESVDLKIAKIQ